MRKAGGLVALLAAALAVMLLVGCKMDVTPEIYVSDLRAVAESGEVGLSTPAILSIGIGTKDRCEERAAQFEAMLGEMVREFSTRGCEGSGTDVALVASIQIPIVSSPEAWEQADSLYGILAFPAPAESRHAGNIGVFFLVNAERFAQLNQRVKSEFYRAIDLSDSRVKVVLSNDERTEARFTVNDAYFNGQPVQGLDRTEQAIARRHDAEVVLSNVALSALVQGQPVPTLLLAHP